MYYRCSHYDFWPRWDNLVLCEIALVPKNAIDNLTNESAISKHTVYIGWLNVLM